MISKTFVAGVLLFCGSMHSGFLSAQTAGESWRFPQKATDCSVINWPIYQERLSALRQAGQCHSELWPDHEGRGGGFGEICSSPWFGQRRNFASCASYENNFCTLDKTISSRRKTCYNNLRVFQERKREEEKRRKEEKRLAEERQRYYEQQSRRQALANNARAQDANNQRIKAMEERQQQRNADDGRIARFVNDRYGSLSNNGPANLAGDTYRFGSIAAQAATGRSLPLNSSMRLSSAISAIGSRFIVRQHEQALGQFNDAMSEFDRNNPRPTRSQRDEYITGAGNQFVNQLGDHVERINQSEQAQSLSPQSSLVAGVGAELIAGIVKMRNEGEISESLGNITTVFTAIATAVMVYRIEKEEKKKAALEKQQLADARAQSESLRAQRQAIFKDITQQDNVQRAREQRRQESVKSAAVINPASVARSKQKDRLVPYYCKPRGARSIGQWYQEEQLRLDNSLLCFFYEPRHIGLATRSEMDAVIGTWGGLDGAARYCFLKWGVTGYTAMPGGIYICDARRNVQMHLRSIDIETFQRMPPPRWQ